MSRRRIAGGILLGTLVLAPGAAQARGSRVLRVSVGTRAHGRPLPRGFVGVSLEYSAVRSYTGTNPSAVNPVLVALLKDLAPGVQRPVLRIGGDSTDDTWWPIPGTRRPAGIRYALTRGWLATTRALAGRLNARLIMGVNLAAGRPRLAAAEGRTFLRAIGRHDVQAFEIGNEPDLYRVLPWYQDGQGQPVFSRPSGYGFSQFRHEFWRWSRALPASPLAGPALASTAWFGRLDGFMSAPRLRVVTVHRYPLRACIHNPRDPAYPTIGRLLSDRSSLRLVRPLAPHIASAHRRGLTFRLDEINSASCSGRPGVSNTFASALWALDTLFALARAGVDGVNLHTWPGASYQLFRFSHRGGRWRAFVAPEYYGLLMFTRAFPAGARLEPVRGGRPGPVNVWATRGHGGRTRVVLINKGRSRRYTIRLRVPGVRSPAIVQWLRAPRARSTTAVRLGGQTFGRRTATGRLAGPARRPVLRAVRGTYTVRLPPASALLLTLS